MYRYFQTSEKSSWSPILDGPQVEALALQNGARKLTILAVSEVVDEGTDHSSLAYKGPFYADIDVKGDIPIALRSTKELCNKLKGLDVPPEAIHVFASGGKGFHVIVPAHVFSTGRPVKQLPSVYKEMALELYVMGMDLQVYCGGRGNSWRIENLKRDDGNYRVPLTLNELFSLHSEEDYKAIVSGPRPRVHEECEGIKAAGLAALMESAKKTVKAKPKPVSPVPIEKLKSFSVDPPHCIEDLCRGKVKKTPSLNAVSLQLVSFLSACSLPQTKIDSLIDKAADNLDSSKYDSAYKRKTHLTGLMKYNQTGRYKFSCAGIRSVIDTKPCGDCPIKSDSGDTEDAAYASNIRATQDGYIMQISENTSKQLTNFTLEPVAIYVEKAQGGGQDRRVGTMVEVYSGGMHLGSHMMSEGCWASSASFKKEFEGMGNASVFAGDVEIQRVKQFMYSDKDDEIGEVIVVHSVGIHSHIVGRDNIKVYVEPGLSVNELKVKGTHHLAGKVSNPPRVKDFNIPTNGDRRPVEDALLTLTRVTRDPEAAQLLGWFSAAHLKKHFMEIYSKFPLLFVWGNAETGKTETSQAMAFINGVDLFSEGNVMNIPNTTQYPIVETLSTSTTVPRILDEFNRSKLFKRYDQYGETFKAVYNGQSAGRGTLSSTKANGRSRTGAEIVDMALTAPLVVISEQAIDTPALEHRCLQVMLSKRYRADADAKRRFQYVKDNRDELRKLAKALVLQALLVGDRWIKDTMNQVDAFVPDDFVDRPRHAYQTVLTGLEFLKKTVISLGLRQEVIDRLEELQTNLIKWLTEQSSDIAMKKKVTEVDNMITDMALMATDQASPSGHAMLQEGRHYLVQEHLLYLDLAICHTILKRFKSSQREEVVIGNPQHFSTLLKQEPYYVGEKAVPDFSRSRPLHILDMSKMEEKGMGFIRSYFTQD